MIHEYFSYASHINVHNLSITWRSDYSLVVVASPCEALVASGVVSGAGIASGATTWTVLVTDPVRPDESAALYTIVCVPGVLETIEAEVPVATATPSTVTKTPRLVSAVGAVMSAPRSVHVSPTLIDWVEVPLSIIVIDDGLVVLPPPPSAPLADEPVFPED